MLLVTHSSPFLLPPPTLPVSPAQAERLDQLCPLGLPWWRNQGRPLAEENRRLHPEPCPYAPRPAKFLKKEEQRGRVLLGLSRTQEMPEGTSVDKLSGFPAISGEQRMQRAKPPSTR